MNVKDLFFIKIYDLQEIFKQGIIPVGE